MVAGAGIRGALVALACLAAIALVSAASAGAPSKSPPPVTCKMRPGAHLLEVTARDRRERVDVVELPPGISPEVRRDTDRLIDMPASVTIERRIDEITVIDDTERLPTSLVPATFYGPDTGGIRSCGPRPTVTSTDAIDVRLGRHAESADLLLDLRYGRLEPGFTDEGDGSSELEIDARLGFGTASVRMTRNTDQVAVAKPPTATPGPGVVNLNSDEPASDADLTVGRRAFLLVDGGGGDDALSSTGGEGDPDEVIPAVLVGGQGADVLTGGGGSDALVGGPGRNLIDAAGGHDAVIASGRARDRIDCGPGRDFVFLLGGEQRLRNCERALTPRELERGVNTESAAIANRVRELVRAAR